MARKLSIMDSGWLMMETRETPMHVGGLALFAIPEDAPSDYMESVYRFMVEVDGVCRPFSQKIQSRLPGRLDAAWVEDRNFDIDYHVRHSALPRPGRVRELLALVSRLHAQRLDPGRPLWESYLIEGLEGNRFALYTKMHHSMVDGMAGMHLMQSRMASSADENLPAPWSGEWDKRKKPRKKSVAVAAKAGVLDGAGSVRRGAGQLVDLLRLPKDSNVKTIYRAPKTVLNRRVTGARRFAAQSWSLPRIKAAAKKHNGTVNDIFLAMCGGAMRRYLETLDALPAEPLVAQVPVSLRSADQAEGGGNAITTVQVSLATHIASPLGRLVAIQESMQAVKTRLGEMQKSDIDAYTVMTNMPLSLGQVTGLSGRVSPMFNLVISNVPGPKDTLYFNGAELLASYPVSLVLHGYALNITVVSYKDSLEFGVIGCRDTLPHIQRFLDYFEASLAELE
ncbi:MULTISPECIES: wax ester/triacylglycerol synthase family O-acyltransferase [unclassified Alcanivorax]|uniref:WS/DGAT/MGAT family O-acyltransferase n=1 Tax=unclassified Alcanivorax TaxID=2638842 RepID=UPI0008A0597B|nr:MULTISPECIES: wax ester/triacylglycerol synthase family O-acyltransferase [unclassified Alcanivorax]MBU84999.1 wax ester/triacylglycerol synthase family O-acyltransferase [Alcanivorax sp.]MEE3387851.1 wax ester/triacylglycerol synthase family O-acyltransferase [Pseudomonadota bacterium]SEG25964.1 diacylglycerol O-acyltransferase [Alcanivorax sp. DSM 26293]